MVLADSYPLGATTITIAPSGSVPFSPRYTVSPSSAVRAAWSASIVGVPRVRSTTFAVMVTPVSTAAPTDCAGATIPQWGGYIASIWFMGVTGILSEGGGQCARSANNRNSWVENSELSGSSTYRTQNELGGGAPETVLINASWSTILRGALNFASSNSAFAARSLAADMRSSLALSRIALYGAPNRAAPNSTASVTMTPKNEIVPTNSQNQYHHAALARAGFSTDSPWWLDTGLAVGLGALALLIRRRSRR